jgi:hypothetical protein
MPSLASRLADLGRQAFGAQSDFLNQVLLGRRKITGTSANSKLGQGIAKPGRSLHGFGDEGAALGSRVVGILGRGCQGVSECTSE